MRFIRTVLLVSLLGLVVAPAALAIRFTDDSYDMPTATVGKSFYKEFHGASGCGPALPYQYTLIGGKLPPGLSLSFGGVISGTPTTAGSFSFWVNLSDQDPPSASWCRPAAAQREFTIRVEGGATPVAIDQSTLNPKATVLNTPYNVQLTAHGGGAKTWSIQSGALPGGLTLSPGGLLSGTPTITGDFTFNVKVTDGATTATRTFTLSVVSRLSIAPVSPVQGEVSLPLQVRPAAAGGKGQYTWSLAADTKLPDGVTFDSTTGALGGRPTVAGSFPLKLTVTDTLGFTDTVDVHVEVATKLAIATKAVSAGKALRRYRVRLQATGGAGPRTWTIVGGKLPAGIHLAKSTGALTGKPRRAGTAGVVIQVTDSLGAVAKVRLVLKVQR